MVDPVDTAEAYRDEVMPGLEFEWEPQGGGGFRLAAYYDGSVIESGEYPSSVLSKPNVRGKFLNSVEQSLDDTNGIDSGDARTALKQYIAELADLSEDESVEYTLSDAAGQIIKGTEKVEVHQADETVWYVTLEYNGETARLEFSNGEMLGDGGALVEKIANRFVDFIELSGEEWQEIRERWADRKEIVERHGETATDAIINRVVTYMDQQKQVVADREKVGNGTETVWYDSDNATLVDEANADGAIVWVRDEFVTEAIEAAGKSVEQKAPLVRDMSANGVLYRGNMGKQWGEDWSKPRKVYPFNADHFTVTDSDLNDGGTAHSEVQA
jgi:hypothetical protein